MAFQSEAAKATGTNNDNWKASGFINIYLPTKNGGKRKVGAIPLRDMKAEEKRLCEHLNADPANMADVASKFIIEYQSATPSDENGFDL